MRTRRIAAGAPATLIFFVALTLLPAHFSYASTADVGTADANVLITEFLPNPVGKDSSEWIELHNDGTDLSRLDGWSVDDGDKGSKPYPLFGLAIPAGGYLVVLQSQSKIVLNNDKDSVRLIAPDGTVRENIPYVLAPEGNSFALVDGVWMWSDSPTPGGVNTRPTVQTIRGAPVGGRNGPVKKTPRPTSGSGTDAAATTNLQDVINKNDGTTVITEGVVTLPPGRIGTRTFAIQVRGGGAGALVRAYGSRAMPAIASGDLVRISAKTGAQLHGAVLLASSGEKILRLSGEKVVYAPRDLSSLTDADVGAAITAIGDVTAAAKGSMIIMDSRGQKEISVSFPFGPAKSLKVGDAVEVTGVILLQKNGLEIDTDDSSAVRTTGVKDAGATSAQSAGALQGRQPTAYAAAAHDHPYVIGIVVLAAVLAVGAILLIRKRRARRTDLLFATDATQDGDA